MRCHGRKLRVLHVVNIAGNARVAAEKLREVAVEADVLASEDATTAIPLFPGMTEADQAAVVAALRAGLAQR